MANSDKKKLAALLTELRAQGEGGSAEGACIDAMRFLDGNEDLGSLGCNLDDHPGMGAFRHVIAKVVGRSDVSSVQVRITEDMGDDEFPFTDAVLVCTSATAEQLKQEFTKLTPTDVYELSDSDAESLPKSRNGQRWLSVFWD